MQKKLVSYFNNENDDSEVILFSITEYRGYISRSSSFFWGSWYHHGNLYNNASLESEMTSSLLTCPHGKIWEYWEKQETKTESNKDNKKGFLSYLLLCPSICNADFLFVAIDSAATDDKEIKWIGCSSIRRCIPKWSIYFKDIACV